MVTVVLAVRWWAGGVDPSKHGPRRSRSKLEVALSAICCRRLQVGYVPPRRRPWESTRRLPTGLDPLTSTEVHDGLCLAATTPIPQA